ncbi:MAG: GDSL-type esterase/lipase family protein [Candidatus Melainabacteria bacterium]|nr:GDSL-type esterase/lipase family protein [Candidatus Melainabacteria bacterium]
MSTEVPPDSNQVEASVQPQGDKDNRPLTVASLDSTIQPAQDLSQPVGEMLLADARDPRDHRRPHHRGPRPDHQNLHPRVPQTDMRFRRSIDPNQSNQNLIYQQRLAEQQRRQQQQQWQQQQWQQQQWRPRQQQQWQQQQWQQQQWQQSQFQNFGQFNGFMPASYRPGPGYQHFNNFRGHHDGYRHRRQGPDVMDIVGTLSGIFAGLAIDSIDRQQRRESRPASVEVSPGDNIPANKPKDTKVAAENERSEPFTAKSRSGKENWSEEHGALVERARNNRGQTVIYGDGNVKALGDNPQFKTLGWQEFGISHDRSENLLWRLRNGEANFNKDNPPKNAVMMIGTNNIGRATTDDIVRGIMENHKELRTKLPNAQIIVVGVLPKGDDASNNQQIQEINRKVAEQLKDKPNTVFVDARSALMNDNQYIPELWKPAHINLTTQGQNKLLEVINAKLKK